jgi:hypothetical protein
MSAAQQRVGFRWRVAFTAIRDVGMTGLALWGVWHQEHTGHVNPWLLLTYVVILGLIPANHAVALAMLRAPALATEATRSAPDTAGTPQ